VADKSFTARWVFPVSGPPLERGVLLISDDRVIAAAKYGRATADLDFGNAAIVPGFVNAHTHLDLTGARGLTPPTQDFTAWLRSVIAYRKSRTPEQVDADIQAGIAECLRFGTTTVNDISVDGRSFDLLAESSIRSIVFHEILGMSADRAKANYIKAKKWMSGYVDFVMEKEDWSDRDFCTDRALSPHAPYSVRFQEIQAAFKHCMSWKPFGWPLTIHLAETHDEIELLENHSGPFVEFLKELGAWYPDDLAPSVRSIIELTHEQQEILFVHGNYLAPETPIPLKSSIVYCPRTHAAFGHAPHPFREFLARGVHIQLGTDSLASNPDLSVLAEARFIASRFPDFDRATLLGMAAGTLKPSVASSADFAVVALPDRDEADPHELLFNSDLPVQSTWFRGECVFKLDSAT
jgi:aminodeoxyfutalosine deaminase